MHDIAKDIPVDLPVLIAGPTASGKSELALRIAEASGGVIVNADALQVFECWQILSARPGAADLERAPHALYGHVPFSHNYSTGEWLRDVAPFLGQTQRPIIVGGTGLNFTALTEGLAEIPPTPADIRNDADAMTHADMLDALDGETASRIDTQNPARVQRAWEVWRSTGQGIAHWQDLTPPPLLPLKGAFPIVLEADRDWLAERITRRFSQMLGKGAIDEVRALHANWDAAKPAAKAIGAPELIAYLNGALSLEDAQTRAVIATRQYAKRQRTWFRARMKNWHPIDARNL